MDDAGDGEEEDEEKKDKDKLNESTKIQDLTSQMLSIPVKAKGCGCACVGKKKRGKTAKPAAMPLDPTDREKGLGTPYGGSSEGGEAEGGEVAGGDAGMALAEAETEATGADLVEKVRKCVQKLFKEQETDANKIEVKEVPETAGAYYCALKFGNAQTDEQK